MINNDSEQILIGTWLIGEELQDMKMFQPSQFRHYGHLFRLLKSGERDMITLSREADVPIAELNGLISCGGYKLMYESAIDNLRKDLADEWILNNPDASPEEIMEKMKTYKQRVNNLPQPSENPVEDLIEDLDRRQHEKIVTTGLKQLDDLLCGVRKKELTAVGARPSVGKSAFMQQVAINVAKQGKKVLFFPLEMSELAITQRMLLRYVRIPQKEIRSGLRKESWEKSSYALEEMKEFIDSGNWLVFERCNDLNIIKELIEYHKPYMVVIDQLEQLADGDMRFPDKRSRFSHMTHELQAISLDMDVAVWIACQVNRSADDSPPTMANLKESGTIEEDATNVILLHRMSEKVERQDIQIELAKQKDGACGVMEVKFFAPKFTFYEFDY